MPVACELSPSVAGVQGGFGDSDGNVGFSPLQEPGLVWPELLTSVRSRKPAFPASVWLSPARAGALWGESKSGAPRAVWWQSTLVCTRA